MGNLFLRILASAAVVTATFSGAGLSAQETTPTVAVAVAARAASTHYDELPAAARTYAEGVRASCKEYNPDGVPADRMSGIMPVALSDGTPATIIDNEGLCSDHYAGANCSNRGCDVVVMIQSDEADKGWKEIFHEHLYEKTFNIGDDKKLKSISAHVYAGDPHCGTASGAKRMSSDSCKVEIFYQNKNWRWQKLAGVRQPTPVPEIAAPARDKSYCSPKTTAARILAKPAPNALHPDWRGDSFVGTGWTFFPRKTVSNITGSYAQGDLAGSRGGIVNRNVFILLPEWECEGVPVRNAGNPSPTALAATTLSELPSEKLQISNPGVLNGTWMRLADHCRIPKGDPQGHLFRIMDGTLYPGGVECGKMSTTIEPDNLLKGDGQFCRVAGQGLSFGITYHYRYDDQFLSFDGASDVVDPRFERCEGIEGAFRQDMPFRFSVVSVKGNTYVFTIADWGKLEPLGRVRLTSQIIGYNEKGEPKYNHQVSREVIHVPSIPRRSDIKFGYRLLVPKILPGDRVEIDMRSHLEENTCSKNDKSEVLHAVYDASMRGNWFLWNVPDNDCLGGFRQVLSVGGRNIVSRTMKITQ